jgi:hypothetical protein
MYIYMCNEQSQCTFVGDVGSTMKRKKNNNIIIIFDENK